MCGRFVSSSPPDELARYFAAAPPETLLPQNHNVAPTTDIYAVRERPPAPSTDASRSDVAGGSEVAGVDGAAQRVMETFHWGLIPMWAKEQKIGNRMINARAETISSKGAFKASLARRRCLIPADGFYEWKRIGGVDKAKPTKQPMFISRVDGEPLVLAGIWERWRGPDRSWDEALHSTTIITTAANQFMTDIHDRMPVLLAPENWDDWLDPANDDIEALVELLVPAPEGLLRAHPVDPRVGNVRNKGADLIDRYTPPSEATLFGAS